MDIINKMLINGSISIIEAMENLKNNTYVLPPFQRDLVWNMKKITKLWDSILQGYPISTFLFWKINQENVTDKVFFYSFRRDMDNVKKNGGNYGEREIYYDAPKEYIAVLDGQQRLTALYLSLYGKVKKNDFEYNLYIELDQNKIFVDSDDDENDISLHDDENDISLHYDIRFICDDNKLTGTQFLLRNILKDEYRDITTREQAIENEINKLHIPEDSRNYAREILNVLCKKVYGNGNADQNLINYTLAENYSQSDALQIFIRLNSSGEKLSKATITKSTISARWKDANTKFDELLQGGFKFSKGEDFIVRTAHMLWGDVVKAPIEDYKVIDHLKNEWDDLCNILKDLQNEVLGKENIQMLYFATRWNILIPIIYSMYKNEHYKENLDDIKAYLMRAVLLGYFRNGTPSKLSKLKKAIDNSKGYKIDIQKIESFEEELRMTAERLDNILELEYNRNTSTDALYFLSLEWNTGEENYKRHKDHLHAKNFFESRRPPCSADITEDNWRKWKSLRLYNRLPNLQFLESSYNEEKSGKPLDKWYSRCNDDEKKRFSEHGYIPNVDLSLENFENFYNERKKLLSAKLAKLLKCQNYIDEDNKEPK